jgi:hypothetical protein
VDMPVVLLQSSIGDDDGLVAFDVKCILWGKRSNSEMRTLLMEE